MLSSKSVLCQFCFRFICESVLTEFSTGLVVIVVYRSLKPQDNIWAAGLGNRSRRRSPKPCETGVSKLLWHSLSKSCDIILSQAYIHRKCLHCSHILFMKNINLIVIYHAVVLLLKIQIMLQLTFNPMLWFHSFLIMFLIHVHFPLCSTWN